MNVTNKESKEAQDAIKDCIALARMEGLEGHARAAECRLVSEEPTAKKLKVV
jgi:histidinol dehydrogenase